MPQPRAYTDDVIIATGHPLLARGVEPGPKALHEALGGRGDPRTAWRAWEAHLATRRREGSGSLLPSRSDDPPVAPAVAAAREAVRAAIVGLTDAERKEIEDRHARRSASQERHIADLERRIVVLEELLALAEIAEEAKAAPKPALILPGR